MIKFIKKIFNFFLKKQKISQKTSEEVFCWICMDSESTLNNILLKPCKCPGDRYVHKDCLIKWQIHNIGKEEETNCRFCKETLPDWKQALQNKNKNIIKIALYLNNKHDKMIYLDPTKTPDLKKEFLRILQEEYKIDGVQLIEFISMFKKYEIHCSGINSIDSVLCLANFNANQRFINL